MAAIPPLAGFIAKEEAYAALVHGGTGDRAVLVGIVSGSVLTVAYSLRFAAALVRPDLISRSVGDRAVLRRGPGLGLLVPGVVLATGSVALGVVLRARGQLGQLRHQIIRLALNNGRLVNDGEL